MMQRTEYSQMIIAALTGLKNSTGSSPEYMKEVNAKWKKKWFERRRLLHQQCSECGGVWMSAQRAIHVMCQVLEKECQCEMCEWLAEQVEKEYAVIADANELYGTPANV